MDKELSAFVNLVVQAAIPVVFAAIAGFLAKTVAPALADFWKSSVDEKTQTLISDAIVVVVRAAEEAGLVAKLKDESFDKLAYAVEMAGRFLAQYGIDLDEEVIIALIRDELARQIRMEAAIKDDAGAQREVLSNEALLEKHWA